MTTKRNGKEQAARIIRPIDFIEMKSEANSLASLSRILFCLRSMYDLHALLCTSSGRKTNESDDTILKTILYDLVASSRTPKHFVRVQWDMCRRSE